MAIRFKRVKNLCAWTWSQIVDEKKVNKNYRKRKGRIMFPTSHDITLRNLQATVEILEKLQDSGNTVLLTTKPDFNCIQWICDHFYLKGKGWIQFRFTITSTNDLELQQWEPNAPSFNERMKSLQYAFERGFRTSISIEPYLDPHLKVLIEKVEPYVTESIWIGIMNKRMLPPEGKALYEETEKEYQYSKDFIQEQLPVWEQVAKGKLRLKDSIRNMFDKCLVCGNLALKYYKTKPFCKKHYEECCDFNLDADMERYQEELDLQPWN